MKKQIRRGVFETNSSSSHSMQISNEEMYLHDMLDILVSKYREEIKNGGDGVYFYKDDFISTESGERKLIIKGFDIGDSDENSILICAIKSPIAKVQYLYMLLKGMIEEYCAWTKQPFIENKYDSDIRYEKYDIMQLFGEICVEELNKLGENLNGYVFGERCGGYYDGNHLWLDDGGYIFNKGILTNKKLFKEQVESYIGDDKKVILYKDIAYHPYDKPILSVI